MLLDIQIKQLEKKVTAIRKVVIADLKKLIGKDTLGVYNHDIFINDYNTEDMFRHFTNKGGETEYDKNVPWKELSTDMLLLILKVLKKNIHKLK